MLTNLLRHWRETKTPSKRKTEVSLIIGTLGRPPEILKNHLENLCKQEFKNFDVIIVDQNADHRLAGILNSKNWPYPIRRLHRPEQRGVTSARNEGLWHATGNIVLFPDDDCWYPPWFLAKGVELLARHKCASITGRAADEAGRSINGRFAKQAAWVDRTNVWITQIEWVVFFRRDALLAVGGYDEALGAGSAKFRWAYEGQDLTLRLLEAGHRTYYDPELYAHHEELDTRNPDDSMLRKGRAYSRGFGYVLRKHHYYPTTLIYWLLRPIAGALFALIRGEFSRARYYVYIGLGRIEGWLQFLAPIPASPSGKP